MIEIRRSKVNEITEFLNEFKKVSINDFGDENPLMGLLGLLDDYRKTSISEDFTEEEYNNTFIFVKLLNDEKYDYLIDYKIIED